MCDVNVQAPLDPYDIGNPASVAEHAARFRANADGALYDTIVHMSQPLYVTLLPFYFDAVVYLS